MMVVVFDDDVEGPTIDGGGFDAGRGGALGISTTDGLLLLSRLSFDGCGDPKVLKDGLKTHLAHVHICWFYERF